MINLSKNCISTGLFQTFPNFRLKLVNCEYSHWSQWSACNKACGGGTQNRSREATRQPWYGGVKCSEKDSKDETVCNVDACPGTK